MPLQSCCNGYGILLFNDIIHDSLSFQIEEGARGVRLLESNMGVAYTISLLLPFEILKFS